MKILYMLLLILGAAGQSVFSKSYSVKSNIDKGNSPHVFNLYYSALIALITLIASGFSLDPSGLTWLFAAVAGITATLYNIGIVGAATSGPYPVYAVSSIFGGLLSPLILEFTVFNVRIPLTGYTGIILMLAAILLMTGIFEKACRLSGKFILCCLLIFSSNGIFGISLILQTRLSGRADGERSEFIFLAYAIAALLSLVILAAKNRKDTFKAMRINYLPALFTLGASGSATLSRYMSLICIQTIGATVSTPVSNGGVLIIVALLSFVLFKEKQTKLQIAGDALAIVSIVLISI